MNNCIFCKIINDNTEASFVYKGEHVSAFMDLNAINTGHVLVVPNEHNERFVDINPTVAGEMFQIAQKILAAIQESEIRCEGANIFLSDGFVAGQEVPHSHLHIAPRFKDDGHKMGFSHYDPNISKREELDKAAKAISSYL